MTFIRIDIFALNHVPINITFFFINLFWLQKLQVIGFYVRYT